MQRRHLVRSVIACATLAAFGVAALAADAPKKIRIGVEGGYPPFSEVGPDGKLKGFDIDMANALCAEMKADCTLVQSTFDAMIPSLQARKFDAVIASLSITPERQKAVAFTNKYYNTPARLVVKTGAKIDASPEGLKGKRIGVQRSTTHDRYATDIFKSAEIVRYGKQDEVFLDLAAGRIDAVLVDSVAVDVGFLKTPQGKGFTFTGPVYNDPVYFGVGAGIALRKADTALLAQFNDALRAIRANGVYKKLQDKYFDFDVYGDPKLGILDGKP